MASTLTDVVAQPAANRRWYGRSFGDPNSRMFWSGDALYVGFLPEYAQFFSTVPERVTRKLTELGHTPAFEPVAAETDGFGTIYRIWSSARITYSFEWSPSMWKAAATCVLELLLFLARERLTLRNPQPWYVVFDGPHPIYLNPGTVVRADAATFAKSWDKIERFFLRPLVLAEASLTHVARQLLCDVHRGVERNDLPMDANTFAQAPSTSSQEPMRTIEQILKQVNDLRVTEDEHRWTTYETDTRFTATSSWSKKEQLLVDAISRFGIGTVTDLGANSGHYTAVAARCGCSVVGADFDESLVSRMWRTASAEKLSVTSAVMDFTNPSPGYGVTNSWFPPATERLKSSLVLCFALTHHLVFGRYRLNFSEIARGVKSFSSRFALVEFCPAKRAVVEWRPDSAEWYFPERLADSLRLEFGDTRLCDAADDGRQIIVCGPKESLR